MNPYVNEDVMWQRLKDLQMEAENRRLAGQAGPGVLEVVRLLVSRAWLLAGLAMRRPPRPTWVETPSDRDTRAA